jgi:Ca-activated chloride channel homolog
MSFLAPLAFLGLVIAIPILLLYMLRLRRQEHVISSTFLWQQVIQDTEANTPWQRLRRNLLLFLQLLIVLLMVLALMRPFVTVPTISAGKIALLIDGSASMNATDINGQSRFSEALKQAEDIINNMNPQDAISLIRVSEVAEPITSYTSDPAELRFGLNSMTVGLGQGDWDTALTLAAAGAAGAENFSIVMISDGGIGSATSLPANIPQPIYVPIGQSADNVAITALATRALAGQPPQLFAQVTNYGDEPAEISLVIRLDDVLRLSRSGIILPKSQLPIPFDEPITDPFETLSASLTFDGEGDDYLSLDNTAWTVQNEVNTRRILYMSNGDNLFVEQALRSLPGVQTFRGNSANPRLPRDEFDLYVFNNWLPDILPDGDMLIIDPPHTTPLFAVGDDIEDTSNIDVLPSESAITIFVDLDEMSLLKFRDITADWAEPLITTGGGDILLAGETNGQQIAILPFDVRDSNLPLLIAYPVLMANLVDWFSPADIVLLPDGLSVGDSVVIHPPLLADSVRVTAPNGKLTDLPINSNTLIFTDTSQLGLYRLEIIQGGEVSQSQNFAVNLFATGESDITPIAKNVLTLGGTEADGEANEQLGLREFWGILALLTLIILSIEWVVYHRRLRVPTILTPIQRRRQARAQTR